MSSRLSTGIGALDRKLGGGIPPGSIVSLSAPPASQSEQFLSDLTEIRRTLVLTTRRPREVVERSLSATSTRPEHIAVREIGPNAPLEEIHSLLEPIDGETNLIVDPLDPLEQTNEARFVAFFNAFRSKLASTDSLAILHCLDGTTVPPHRDLTLYMSDVVFELSTAVRGDRLENRLLVPKFRGGYPFDEAVKLELTNEVGIDTSRDIG